MVRSLFTYIVYDFDTRRIVDFRLKPWADRWLALRAALYEPQQDQDQKSKSPDAGDQDLYTDMPHRGIEPLF
jgi:hypothetical protein